MQYTNDASLNAALLNEFQGIVNKVAENVLNKIIESMNNVVYFPYSPQKYERNGLDGGLLGSFRKDDAKISGQSVQSSVEHRPDTMKFNPMKFQHGSFYYDPTDIRDFLMTIIIEGKSGPIFGEGAWTQERDFWSPVLEAVKNGDYDIFIQDAMTEAGLSWIKI